MGPARPFETLKLFPQWHISSYRDTPLDSSNLIKELYSLMTEGIVIKPINVHSARTKERLIWRIETPFTTS